LAANSSWRFRSSSSCLRFSSFNSNYERKLMVSEVNILNLHRQQQLWTAQE
jgi:hypothetical protein